MMIGAFRGQGSGVRGQGSGFSGQGSMVSGARSLRTTDYGLLTKNKGPMTNDQGDNLSKRQKMLAGGGAGWRRLGGASRPGRRRPGGFFGLFDKRIGQENETRRARPGPAATARARATLVDRLLTPSSVWQSAGKGREYSG